jgi:hypothetical protein
VILDQLRRLVKVITHSDVVRPTPAETAMHASVSLASAGIVRR